jgi:hypothetical protein
LIRILAFQHREELGNAWYFFHAPLATLGDPAEPVAVRALPDFHVAAVPLFAANRPDRTSVPFFLHQEVNAPAEQRQRDAEKKADQHNVEKIHPTPLNEIQRSSVLSTTLIAATVFLRGY